MGYSLCSYSFHRTSAAGEIDIFGYIDFCKQAGFTGCWGIESTPNDGKEAEAAIQTLALLKRTLEN